MKLKQVIRAIAFFILTFFVLVLLSDLFEYKIDNISRRYEKFKRLEKGTIDAVYIGTSGVDRYWIGAKAYEDYGMTVYPLSSEGATSWLMKNLLVEAVKRQNPKLIIIDTRPFTVDEAASSVTLADTRCRRVIDMLPFFSANRLDVIKRSVIEMDKIDTEKSKFDLALSYYFSFIRYHNKWSDEAFTFDELGREQAAYLGFYVTKGSSVKSLSKQAKAKLNDERIPLDETAEKYLLELIDYIKEQNLNVLFVDTPYAVPKEAMSRRNTLFDLLEEKGMPYISYNSTECYEELGLDFKEDFYNSNHVNYYGAEKFTKALSKYINDNYDFEDHRNDERCAEDWNGIYTKIVKKMNSFVSE